VQSVNAKARTAKVRLTGREQVELVPLLELDAYGNSGGAGAPGLDALGVRRGDTVFVHAPGTTNGAEQGRAPRIGEMPEWAKDNHEDAAWRERMKVVGMEEHQRRMGGPPPREESFIRKTEKGDATMNWIGEVTDVSRLHPLVRFGH
jgi:ubiquitin-conjugating enzyme E2 O